MPTDGLQTASILAAGSWAWVTQFTGRLTHGLTFLQDYHLEYAVKRTISGMRSPDALRKVQRNGCLKISTREYIQTLIFTVPQYTIAWGSQSILTRLSLQHQG